MKNWMVLPLALVVSLLTAVLTTNVFAPPVEATAPTAEGPTPDQLAGLQASLARLEDQQRELSDAVRTLGASPSARAAVGGVEEAVERWLDEHAERLLATHKELAALAPLAVDAGMPQLDGQSLATAPIESILAHIASLDDDSLGNSSFWQELRDAGRIGEVVAAFERTAEEDPTNPDLQVAVGAAYLQELFGVGNSPQAGVLAMKADGAFDRALELDPNHWDARFTKAVSLSNWPAFLGKSGEAIQEFETLVEQQKAGPPDSKFAQTYLFLGNMYQQTGEADRALQVWRDGLALYPDSEFLRKQIETNGR